MKADIDRFSNKQTDQTYNYHNLFQTLWIMSDPKDCLVFFQRTREVNEKKESGKAWEKPFNN